MAKAKRSRRTSIRHMSADDPLGVLEALERAEQQGASSTEPPSESEDEEQEPED
jgi:hypothetical protein